MGLPGAAERSRLGDVVEFENRPPGTAADWKTEVEDNNKKPNWNSSAPILQNPMLPAVFFVSRLIVN